MLRMYAPGDGHRPRPNASGDLGDTTRLVKSKVSPVEVIVGLRTRAGVAGPLFDDLRTFSSAGVEARIDRVNGGYDIAGELSGQDFEAIQEAVEQLRSSVGESATLDVSYGSFA